MWMAGFRRHPPTHLYLNVLSCGFSFLLFFGCVHVAYGILVPWPGSVPGPGSDSAES